MAGETHEETILTYSEASGKGTESKPFVGEMVLTAEELDQLVSCDIGTLVTKIGDACFKNCRTLESVSIPSTVTSLGSEAFRTCTNLAGRVFLPDSVQTIGSLCFSGCSNITEINIPYGITRIEDATFGRCSNLTKVTIPSTVISLGATSFGSTAIDEVVIPNSVVTIGAGCFGEAPNLTSVILPERLEVLPEQCFLDTPKYTDIRLPESLKIIGSACFNNFPFGYKEVESLVIPRNVTFIGGPGSDLNQLKVTGVFRVEPLVPPTLEGDPIYSPSVGEHHAQVQAVSIPAYQEAWGSSWTFSPINYSITVNPNGGSGGSVSPLTYQYSTDDQTFTLTPPSTSPSWKVFDGWMTSKGTIDGNTLTIPGDSMGDVTVTAVWKSATCAVEIDPNGGSGGSAVPSVYTAASDEQQQVSLLQPNPPQWYEFDYWTATAGNVIGNTLILPPQTAGDITVTANWKKKSYRIVVDMTGGSGGAATPSAYQLSDSAQTVTLTEPVRGGYTFSSWSTSRGTVSDDTLTIPANTVGDIMVTAVWVKTQYSVTVNPNGGSGGSASPSEYQIENAPQTFSLTRPTPPTEKEFDFWSSEAGVVIGDTLTISANTTGNIVVKANWKVKSYPLTIAAVGGIGGSATPSFYQKSSSAQTVTLTPPVRGGYTFANWTASKGSVSGNVLTIPANTTGEITLTASWTVATYQIRIYTFGGTGGSVSPSSYTFSTSSDQTATLTRPTHATKTFSRWTANKGSVSGDTLTIPKGTYGDIAVGAVWKSEQSEEKTPIRTSRYVMTTHRTGIHNDIAVRNHDLDFSEGKNAYADILEAAILTVQGELIYNVNQGIPYFDTAFLSPTYLAVWASRVQDRIRQFGFVKGIESFDYEFDAENSKVDYTARIMTDEGLVELKS